MIKAILAAGALTLAGAAFAQQAPTPDADAAAPAAGPSTQDLNSDVATQLQDQQALNAANQAIYNADTNADQARYDEAMSAHAQAMHRSNVVDARYHRQQKAYADAMTVWRLQVRDCLAGHHKACDAPPPDPANYY